MQSWPLTVAQTLHNMTSVHSWSLVTSERKSGKMLKSLTIALWQIKVGQVREKKYNHINTMKDSNNNYQYQLRAD